MRCCPFVSDRRKLTLFRRLGGGPAGASTSARCRCLPFITVIVGPRDRWRQRSEIEARLGIAPRRDIGARRAASTLGRGSLDGRFDILDSVIPGRSMPSHGFPLWRFPCRGFTRRTFRIVGGIAYLDACRARFIPLLPLGLTTVPVAMGPRVVRIGGIALTLPLTLARRHLVLIEIVVQTLVVAAEANLIVVLSRVLPRTVVRDHTEIMIRELQIIFRVDPVSRKLRVAGEVPVFFQKLWSITPGPIVNAVPVVAAPVAPVRATIVPAAVAAAGLTIIDQCVILALNAILKRTASGAYQHRAGSGICLPGLPFCTRRAYRRPTDMGASPARIIDHRAPPPPS